MDVPISEQEFVAGFIDGDGCIRICQSHSHTAVVVIAQSCDSGVPPELEYIQRRYGGSICERKPPANSATRRMWLLHVCSKQDTLRLCQTIALRGVLKAPQAAVVTAYLSATPLRWEDAHHSISEMKKNYHNVEVDESRITDAYIAGFFAAEGCIRLEKKATGPSFILKLIIAQQQCPRILSSLQQRIGGRLSSGRNLQLRLSQGDTLRLLDRISIHLVGQKAAQVRLAMEFFSSLQSTSELKRRRSQEVYERMEQVAKKIRELKSQ